MLTVTFPAIYERISPYRSDEEIWSAIDRKAGYEPGKCRIYTQAEIREYERTATMPPAERIAPNRHAARVAGDIGVFPTEGFVVGGLKAKNERAHAVAPIDRKDCPHEHWHRIGNEKRFKGGEMVRQRCVNCKKERTVPESMMDSPYQSTRKEWRRK